MIFPEVGIKKPIIKSISVVFPEPLGPNIPRNSFFLISKLIFLITTLSSYLNFKSLISISFNSLNSVS